MLASGALALQCRRVVTRLREALETLTHDADLRRSMGVRSRELAEREHDTDANCRKIFDLMAEISRPADRGDRKSPERAA